MEMTNKKVINRIFNALIILFFATPFLFMFYGQQFSKGMIGFDFQQLLAANPNLNILFITSFVTPFIGYYMLQIKQELDGNADVEVVLMHLLAVSISFLIMGNITYSLFTGILIYFIFRSWKIELKAFYQYYKKNDIEFNNFIVSLVILIIAVTIRIMLTLVANA